VKCQGLTEKNRVESLMKKRGKVKIGSIMAISAMAGSKKNTHLAKSIKAESKTENKGTK
jgi:hypothetical protein